MNVLTAKGTGSSIIVSYRLATREGIRTFTKIISKALTLVNGKKARIIASKVSLRSPSGGIFKSLMLKVLLCFLVFYDRLSRVRH